MIRRPAVRTTHRHTSPRGRGLHHGGMESQIIRHGYLTAHQTARVLGIGLPAVRKLVQRRQLERAGGSVGQPWYAVDDVAALALKRRTVKAA